MRSIFNANDRQSILNRVDALHENAVPDWGTMSAAQMCKHCAICEDYYYGNHPIKRSLLGRIVGKMALKEILKDEDSSLRRNSPTSSIFKVAETGLDFETERKNWKRLIAKYESYDKNGFVHWFFGPMTREQLGQFIYKHSDHHLRQFGV